LSGRPPEPRAIVRPRLLPYFGAYGGPSFMLIRSDPSAHLSMDVVHYPRIGPPCGAVLHRCTSVHPAERMQAEGRGQATTRCGADWLFGSAAL